MLKRNVLFVIVSLGLLAGQAYGLSYPIVDTGQNACFDDTNQIQCPESGEGYNGQDAQYKGNRAIYKDNGDGTVTDLVTGLMWVRARGEKVSWADAMDGAEKCRVGGYTDWRAPTIKELYSLIDFNGWVQRDERSSMPFIDIRYFDFAYGDLRARERIIDCQDWSATLYKGKTMGGNTTAFGVNFADGRIKGYGTTYRRSRDKKFIRYVRGNVSYGKNEFANRLDGTVVDSATGLTWQQSDGPQKYNWEEALAYCENLELAGQKDWRLPSAKELQSIVDYTRSPTTTGSAAINPVFSTTEVESYYWTSTTHLDGPRPSHAVYIAFGRAMGYFSPPHGKDAKRFLDVHGAGAQRSDPKSGDPARYPTGHGPQGDDIRIFNHVRCVAGGDVTYYEPPYKRIPNWKGGNPDNSMMNEGQPQGMESSPDKRRGQNQQGSMRRSGPPQEAFDTCNGSNQGDSCSFDTPRGTLQGICRNMPEGKICIPNRR